MASSVRRIFLFEFRFIGTVFLRIPPRRCAASRLKMPGANFLAGTYRRSLTLVA